MQLPPTMCALPRIESLGGARESSWQSGPEQQSAMRIDAAIAALAAPSRASNAASSRLMAREEGASANLRPHSGKGGGRRRRNGGPQVPTSIATVRQSPVAFATARPQVLVQDLRGLFETTKEISGAQGRRRSPGLFPRPKWQIMRDGVLAECPLSALRSATQLKSDDLDVICIFCVPFILAVCTACVKTDCSWNFSAGCERL